MNSWLTFLQVLSTVIPEWLTGQVKSQQQQRGDVHKDEEAK